MDSEKTQALMTVIDTGSLSAAAEFLGYTPSGISRMMASLESELGFKLLQRHRSGVRPTAECELMLPAFRELSHWGEKCAEIAADIKGLSLGTVTIGTAYNACYGWLSSIVADFREKYPNIEVRFIEGSSTVLCHAIDEHRADMCIVSRREGKYRWLPLIDDPMVAWVPKTHKLSELSAIPAKEFGKAPYIDTCPGQDTDCVRFLNKYGITPPTKYYTSDSEATYAMVAAGLGITVNNNLNSRYSSENVAILPLDPPEIINIGVAMQVDLSPAAEKLAEFIADADKFEIQ